VSVGGHGLLRCLSTVVNRVRLVGMFVVRNRITGHADEVCADPRHAADLAAPFEHKVVHSALGGPAYPNHPKPRLGQPHPGDIEGHERLMAELERLFTEARGAARSPGG
jgi:hypothetical protein